MELLQQAKNGEKRHFELRAGRELHVTRSKNSKTQKYAFSILALSDKGKRVYQYRKRWLVLGSCMAFAMPLSPQLYAFLPDYLAAHFYYIIAVLFFSSLLFFLLLYYTFESRYEFFSTYTQLPLVEFWVNTPTRKTFREFITVLEQTIKQHKEEMRVSYDKQLAGEMRTLRRVSEAGVLTRSVYLAAKAKLLILSDVNYQPPADKE